MSAGGVDAKTGRLSLPFQRGGWPRETRGRVGIEQNRALPLKSPPDPALRAGPLSPLPRAVIEESQCMRAYFMGRRTEAAMTKVDLKPDSEAFVDSQLVSGRYKTASDVVEAALGLMRRRQTEHNEPLADMRAKIKESLDDPRPSIQAEEVFANVRTELRFRAAEAAPDISVEFNEAAAGGYTVIAFAMMAAYRGWTSSAFAKWASVPNHISGRALATKLPWSIGSKLAAALPQGTDFGRDFDASYEEAVSHVMQHREWALHHGAGAWNIWAKLAHLAACEANSKAALEILRDAKHIKNEQ